MKQYIATANSDWGSVYRDETIKASSFHTAFARAGHLAEHRVRRRPKQLTISLRLVGIIRKIQEDRKNDVIALLNNIVDKELS